MVTLTVAAFETRRCLWLFPRPGFFVWANWHGGYVMGWRLRVFTTPRRSFGVTKEGARR